MNAAIKPVTVSAAAIDVGFFATKFTLGRKKQDNTIEVDQFPSITQPIRGGMHNFAMAAERNGAMFETEPGVTHYVGKDIMNNVNTYGSRAVINNFSESSAYKALFLGALYYMAKHHGAVHTMIIKKLVVGLPMNTIYTHSESLKTLVEGEHTLPHPHQVGSTIKVFVQSSMVVAQPQGALINHGVGKNGKPSDLTSLVLDMGGGTFDWFVSKGMVPNHQRCDAAPIGAWACAAAVCEQIHRELKDDPEIMARVDEALRLGKETVKVTGRDYDMAEFWPAVRGVLQHAVEQMQKSVGSLRNIDSILLTGGGSKLLAKVFNDMLPEFAHLVEIDQEPVASNVTGFHMIAEHYAAS